MIDPRPDSSVHALVPLSLPEALGRALGGGLIMAVALGAGTAVGPVVADAVGMTGFAARLVPAALVTAVAMPLVVLALRRRRGSLADIGFGGAGPSLRALLVGVGVTAGSAALVLGAGTAGGMLHWSRPDLPMLAGYIVTNVVIALLLEALPEEATLRGHTWTSLRSRFGGVASALGTTAVFLVVPGVSTVVQAGAARLVGGEGGPVGLAPGGQDPADYLILLTVFGLMLVAARTAVRRAPLWVGIGAHLAFLTVNRVVFEGDRRNAGWSVETTPGAELLVLAYPLVATAVFALWRRRAADGGPGRHRPEGRDRAWPPRSGGRCAIPALETGIAAGARRPRGRSRRRASSVFGRMPRKDCAGKP